MIARRSWIAVGFALSAFLLWWALRDTDLGAILDRARAVDRPLLALAMATGVANIVLRSVRWRASLSHLEEPPTAAAAYHATALGALANNLLPARAGEFVAVSVLGRLSRVPYVAAGSALALTHVLDIAVLIGLAGIGLAVDRPDSGLGEGDTVRNLMLLAGAAVAVALVATWMLLRRSQGSPTAARWSRLAHRLADGLRSFEQPRLLARVVAWTVGLWLVTALGWWSGLQALGLDISFATALVVQTVVALGIALPSAPGFFGPFESAARIGLGLYVADATAGAESAVTFHVLVFFFPVIALGAMSILATGLRPSMLRGDPEPTIDEPPRVVA